MNRMARFVRMAAALLAAVIGVAGCRHTSPHATARPPLSGTVEDGTRIVRLTACRFEFRPSTIVVRRGDRVRLDIFSADVTHGIALREYNIRQTVDAGKTVSVQFVADRAGEFPFRCPVVCGWAWLKMRGRLIVTM
jgi:heme/copper-type cytochrome/quinol oxidase subunit 2